MVKTEKMNKLINTRWHGKNRSTSAYGSAIGFTGRHLDNETDLYYFRARYYDTEQGRFISRDPAGYVDGMGLYNGYFAWSFMMDPSGETCTPWRDGGFEISQTDNVGVILGICTGGLTGGCSCTFTRTEIELRNCTDPDCPTKRTQEGTTPIVKHVSGTFINTNGNCFCSCPVPTFP